eukprot:COSAG02_NODE_45278_length_358_cov_1.401544_1_plen_24_part_01
MFQIWNSAGDIHKYKKYSEFQLSI